jgi:hypothetical protein
VSSLETALERLHLEQQRTDAERERRHQLDLQALLRRAARDGHSQPDRAGGGGEGGGGGGGEGEGGQGGERGTRISVLEQQVGMLDKDNFYYKQSNTNLKRRLRALTQQAEQVLCRVPLTVDLSCIAQTPTPNPEPRTPNPKPQNPGTRNAKRETLNRSPKPKTQIPNRSTPHPPKKPETLNLRSATTGAVSDRSVGK